MRVIVDDGHITHHATHLEPPVHAAEGSYSPTQNALVPRSSLPVYQRQRFPDALLGEITPAMATAVCQSHATRVLIPVNHCENYIVGVPEQPINDLVAVVVYYGLAMIVLIEMFHLG